MSLPAPVICEESPSCCEGALAFYGQGKTYLNAQTGFLLECAPGFSCDAGAYPHPIIVRGGVIQFVPPPGQNPLRATCCDGTILARYLPDGFTQAQFDAAAQSIADELATHLSSCMATQYNQQHARKRTQCIISTTSPLPTAGVGVPYEVVLAQSGAASPVVWSVASGALPSGFSLSTDGVLSGTTMTGGTFAFVVQVTNAGGSCKRSFSLTVSADVPCDLGVADNTDFGDRSVNTCLAGSTDSWTGLPVGTYTVAYVSGGISYTDLDFAAACSVPLGTTSWVANPFGVSAGINSNARLVRNGSTLSQLPFQFPSIVCGRLVTADKSLTALEADFGGSTTGGLQSLESTITLAVAITYPDSASVVPVVWKLTRTRKTAIDYDIQVRIVDLPSLLTSLTPFDSCTAGSGTVWDGTFPAFEPNFNYVNYDYRVSHGFGAFQLNSCRLDTPAVTKVYHDTAGQDTPTGCAWILAVTYKHPSGNRVSWVGLGGNGYSPVGTYVFSSTVIGWTMVGKKTAVRVATAAALPANTRTVNIITADAFGALPAIDGVSLAPGDRVLLKDEALGANNGVYTVTDLGSVGTPFILTRSTDLDTSAEMIRGIFMPVTAGATYAGRHFRLVTNGVITLNATSLSFTAIATTIAVESY